MKNPLRTLVFAIGLLIGANNVSLASSSHFEEKGIASWYGGNFNGKKTASGEKLDPKKLTIAHKTLPFGTVVKITNLENGKIVKAKVNDRGPFIRHRIIDLSQATAKAVDLHGTSYVKIETFPNDEVAEYKEPTKKIKK